MKNYEVRITREARGIFCAVAANEADAINQARKAEPGDIDWMEDNCDYEAELDPDSLEQTQVQFIVTVDVISSQPYKYLDGMKAINMQKLSQAFGDLPNENVEIQELKNYHMLDGNGGIVHETNTPTS